MFLGASALVGSWCTWATAGLGLTIIGCGARSRGEDPPAPETVVVAEQQPGCRLANGEPCPDLCLPQICTDGGCQVVPVICNDDDPCTTDTCEAISGECQYETSTFDLDGDGFRAPRAGFEPGEVGSCGSDCDDRSAAAHPGGVEVCDGVDNDCNGIVDEGATLTDPGGPSILVSGEASSATLGGATHTGDYYAFFFTEQLEHQQGRVIGLYGDGSQALAATDIARVNSDNYAGPLVWTGKAFGLAWEDRRDDAYEIYFNRLDTVGNKLGPDLRITYQSAFSINPSLRYVGNEYVLFWQDKRSGSFGIYGQRLSKNSELLGENTLLTSEVANAEGVRVAVGKDSFGLMFNNGLDGQLFFRSVSFDLSTFGEPEPVSEVGAGGPSLRYNNGVYLVTWSEYDIGPGNSIWGAVLSDEGKQMAPPRRVVGPRGFIRSQTMRALGDRIMLTWSEHDGQTYDIYSQFFSPTFEPQTEPIRLTTTTGNAVSPGVVWGADGELGIVYTERTDSGRRIWLKTLRCQ